MTAGRVASVSGLVVIDVGGAAGVAANEVDDLFHARAGGEDGGDALRFQLWDVFVRNDAAAEDDHVIESGFARQLNNAREQSHVRARQDRQADGVNVFLHGGADDHFGRLPQSRVDDFHAGVAQGAGDDFDAAVVAVESGLG